MNQEELNEILRKHKMWINKEEGGERADLCEVDLVGTNLSEADLFMANLVRANLTRANLNNTNLCGANLYEANLSGANLEAADLFETNLSGANLAGANLTRAKLNGAQLYMALYDDNTILPEDFDPGQHYYFCKIMELLFL
jgi:uncharacterized protein YjbI with pentapeptide repeats